MEGDLVMVFNATFNNISIIFWWSVLLVEETGVHSENHRPVARVTLANDNSAQMAFSLFLFMLYKVFPFKPFLLFTVTFLNFLIHSR